MSVLLDARGAGPGPPRLVASATGRQATRLGACAPAERRALIGAYVASAFPDAPPSTPLGYVKCDWSRERS